jgi:hypothetical protein
MNCVYQSTAIHNDCYEHRCAVHGVAIITKSETFGGECPPSTDSHKTVQTPVGHPVDRMLAAITHLATAHIIVAPDPEAVGAQAARCRECAKLTSAGCEEFGTCSTCWTKWREVILSGRCDRFAAQQPPAIDVVYPLGNESTWQDNELRYSLRSLEKNLHSVGDVYVVGHRPKWLKNVVHIPLDDSHRSNKDCNLIDKLIVACHAGIADRFLFCSDDQMILTPIRSDDLAPYHIGDLATKPAAFWANGKWHRRLRHTFDWLLSRGLPTWHYDSHVPQPIERKTFLDATRDLDYQDGLGYTINTVYFNAVLQTHVGLGARKANLENAANDVAAVRRSLDGKTFLGFNDRGLTPALKQVLAERFPKPSKYEQ